MARDKVVLAYSGGLDTSVAIRWLAENRNADVVAVAVDVGQGGDFEAMRQKALDIGAVDSLVVDAKEEMAEEFCLRALKANALYEGKYPLVSALSRPLIAKHLVAIAEGSGANAVAHGCTGKGNDQVRFETSISALNPALKVLAPARDWGMTREEAIEYADERGIPIPIGKKSPYSIDENLWGRTAECGVLEDPATEPPEEVYEITADPDKGPAEPAYLTIGFRQGKPISLNGDERPLSEIVAQVAKEAGDRGFGRVDMIENRLVGIKSREIYEVPAALALIMAHSDLEDLTLERELLHYKAGVEQKYAELVYYGLWYSPLREALDAFIDATQRDVTGWVRLKVHRGSCRVVGRAADNSLYDYDLATYDRADAFDHQAARGFVELWGLPTKVWAAKTKDAKTGKRGS